ncbi:MAG: uracil-DNA glycosylase [Victivallaceae bacterium]|nr:uracil-DNA glycosylase [Victivallaceae bacterium]
MEVFPEVWRNYLSDFADFDLLGRILSAVELERTSVEVYPPRGAVFRALELTPPENVRVVLIGQDPYHNPGEAQGLAFSVPDGVKTPPSLRNIFKEFSRDLNVHCPVSTDLTCWAKNGVLLLNSVLTVRQNAPGSHRKLNWELFTDAIVRAVACKETRKVFLLWGNFAIAKKSLIPQNKEHLVLTAPHPSPLSAHRGFFGSAPFSQAEKFLAPWRWERNL